MIQSNLTARKIPQNNSNSSSCCVCKERSPLECANLIYTCYNAPHDGVLSAERWLLAASDSRREQNANFWAVKVIPHSPTTASAKRWTKKLASNFCSNFRTSIQVEEAKSCALFISSPSGRPGCVGVFRGMCSSTPPSFPAVALSRFQGGDLLFLWEDLLWVFAPSGESVMKPFTQVILFRGSGCEKLRTPEYFNPFATISLAEWNRIVAARIVNSNREIQKGERSDFNSGLDSPRRKYFCHIEAWIEVNLYSWDFIIHRCERHSFWWVNIGNRMWQRRRTSIRFSITRNWLRSRLKWFIKYQRVLTVCIFRLIVASY